MSNGFKSLESILKLSWQYAYTQCCDCWIQKNHPHHFPVKCVWFTRVWQHYSFKTFVLICTPSKFKTTLRTRCFSSVKLHVKKYRLVRFLLWTFHMSLNAENELMVRLLQSFHTVHWAFYWTAASAGSDMVSISPWSGMMNHVYSIIGYGFEQFCRVAFGTQMGSLFSLATSSFSILESGKVIILTL